MSKNITLNELADFYKKEQTILNDLFNSKEMEQSPKESTVKNILDYSKVLSVRKSNFIGQLDFVLN